MLYLKKCNNTPSLAQNLERMGQNTLKKETHCLVLPLYACILSFMSGAQYVTQERVLKLGKYQILVCDIKK